GDGGARHARAEQAADPRQVRVMLVRPRGGAHARVTPAGPGTGCRLPYPRRIASALVAIAAIAASPGTAAADPEPAAADRKNEARAHFEKARALTDEGAWPAALAEFLRSRQLYPTWGNTLGAATSLKKLGRFDEALDLFERLLKEFPESLPERFKTAAQRE